MRRLLLFQNLSINRRKLHWLNSLLNEQNFGLDTQALILASGVDTLAHMSLGLDWLQCGP